MLGLPGSEYGALNAEDNGLGFYPSIIRTCGHAVNECAGVEFWNKWSHLVVAKLHGLGRESAVLIEHAICSFDLLRGGLEIMCFLHFILHLSFERSQAWTPRKQIWHSFVPAVEHPCRIRSPPLRRTLSSKMTCDAKNFETSGIGQRSIPILDKWRIGSQ